MAKHDDKPIPYEARILDTKGVAQRVDLDYLRRPNRFRDLRRKLAWIAPAAAAVLAMPFLLGVWRAEKVFSNGPVSPAHALFENNCQVCHTHAFSSVPKQACLRCHDGPQHRGKPAAEPHCTTCHVEHRGAELADVKDRNCTACHAVNKVKVTAFREGKHPDFRSVRQPDARPLLLNHAAHMPAQPKAIRGMKLPLKCTDCHSGEMEPVTFEKHCLSCHRRELEFVLPGLPVEAPPAPHTKDTPKIRQFILETYQRLAAENPSLLTRPLDRDLTPEPNAAAWVAKAAAKSEEYLLQNKCRYCHGEFPVRKVGLLRGRYVEGKPEGEPWLTRGEFSHRAHRAVTCSSCHAAARASAKTSDVLIPGLKNCTSCHGTTGARLDRCSTCHLYHNKTQERDRDRRSVEELIGGP